VLLVNAARGGIVDEDALLEALNAGIVAGAGLDVFVEEPAKPGHPLIAHERVICTPHLGASTEQAQVNVSIAIAEQIRDFLVSGVVRNAVNMPSISEGGGPIRPTSCSARSSGASRASCARARSTRSRSNTAARPRSSTSRRSRWRC
jgi:D-3-phosphoglycerate dehydrogenase